MILRSVELKAFGCFVGRTVEFRRGFNLVTGANESGKSTLLAAIPAVLFGVDEPERYRPWEGSEGCAAALNLVHGDRCIRIERDLLTDQVTLLELTSGGQVTDRFVGRVSRQPANEEGKAGRERLARVFGLSPEAWPWVALCFGGGEMDLAAGPGNRTVSSPPGQQPLDNDSRADRRLGEPGDRLLAIRTRRQAGAGAVAALGEVKTRLNQLQEERERDHHDFQQGKKYLVWARQQWEQLSRPGDGGNEAVAASPQGAELQVRAAALRRDYARTGLPDPLPPVLPSLLAEAGEIRQDLVAVQGEETALHEELRQVPKVPWGVTAALVIAAGAASGALAWLRPEIMIPALAGGGLLSGLALILTLSRARAVRVRRAELQERETQLAERREAVQARLVGLDGRFEALGLSPSAVAVARMQKNLENGRQLLASLREVERALQGLGEPVAPLPTGQSLPANLLPQEELPEAEAKLEALGASLAARETEHQALLLRQSQLQVELEELAALAAEEETLSALEGPFLGDGPHPAATGDRPAAAGQSPGMDLSKFSDEIGQVLRQLTGGRYGEVRCDAEGQWQLLERGQRWRPLAYISRGVAASFRLARQLVLSRRLPAVGGLPVLLDEPLESLDRGHLGEALKLLERHGAEQQVILCSRDEQLLKRGTRDRWQLISLDSAVAAPPTSLPERNDDVEQLHLL